MPTPGTRLAAVSDEQPPQPEPVDVRNNRESQAASANAATRVARASDGGAPPRDAPDAGELPESMAGGTAAGSPVAGLEIDPAERDEAVAGDQDAMELDGPAAGHA